MKMIYQIPTKVIILFELVLPPILTCIFHKCTMRPLWVLILIV